jgi:hypothetical protein
LRKLIEAIAAASMAYPEFTSFRDGLFQVLEIEEEPLKVALGIESCFVEISSSKIEFVCGADRVTVQELAKIKQLAEDLKQRYLLPFTGGTDEDYDIDAWVDGNPVMPTAIIGGWEPAASGGGVGIDDDNVSTTSTWSSYKITIELATQNLPVAQITGLGNSAVLNIGTTSNTVCAGDDIRLSDTRSPLPHNHAIAQITNLQTILETKLTAIVSNTEPLEKTDGMVWFEPNAIYPQPWTWNATQNLWMTPPMLLDFGNWSATPNIQTTTAHNIAMARAEKAIPFYGVATSRIQVLQAFGIIRAGAAIAANQEPYIVPRLSWLSGTGAYNNLTDFQEEIRGMSAQVNRRMLNNFANLWIPGNAWSFAFELSCKRSPTNTTTSASYPTLTYNVGAYIKMSRP